MKIRKFFVVITISFIILLLAACNPLSKISGTNEGDPSATRTPNVHATVNASVDATATAQANFDAEVEVAVQATVESLPSPTPQPTVEEDEITEEELAEMIDEAVEEAMSAYDQTYYTTYDAADDGSISEEELYYMDYYMYAAEVALAYADDLMMLYYDLYGAYAYEAIDVMLEMESELEAVAQSLEDIDAIITQGAAYATQAIEELNQALETAEVRQETLTELKDGWLESVQFELDDRTNTLLNLDITELATNREGTITLLHEYADSIKLGFEDGRISPNELFDIAQRGINAQGSIREVGGPALQRFSGDITSMTEQLSRGQWPQAQRSLPSFEVNLPERPSSPNIGLPRR